MTGCPKAHGRLWWPRVFLHTVETRGYINILRIQGRASPPNEPASHPHMCRRFSAFSRSPGHNLDETKRESYSCGQPDRIAARIAATFQSLLGGRWIRRDMLPRSPLVVVDRNITPATARPPSLKTAGQIKVAADDELLFKAVARSASSMAALGGRPEPAEMAAIPGAMALRALGHGHDGHGNATYNALSGCVSKQLVAAQQALAAEQLCRFQSEQHVVTLSQELCAWRNGSFHQQLLCQSERAHADALAAAEAAHSQALAAQAAAASAQCAELELAISTHQAEVVAARERARLAVEKCHAELGVTIETLEGELQSLESKAVRVRAAQLIAEKWRGRGRRAKDMAKHLRETLPLTEQWSREFKRLLLGRGVPREQEGLRALWECQLRCLNSKSHRCRWHPKVLAWCSDVWTRDRGAYEQMAFGNMMILPHPDTIRKLCSRCVAQPGHNDVLYESLGPEGATKGWKDEEREAILKFDEININQGLAWRKVFFHKTRSAPVPPAPRAPVRVPRPRTGHRAVRT